MNREKLPQQLEIIGNILNNKKIVEIMSTAEEGMTIPQLNVKVLQVLAEAVKSNKDDMDDLAMLNSGKTREEIENLSDKEYAKILRSAIVTDVLGFFD